MPNASRKPLALLSFAFAFTVAAAAPQVASSSRVAAQSMGEGGNTKGFDMAPEINLAFVEGAVEQIQVIKAPG